MTISSTIQAQFFQSFKSAIPSYASLVDEVAETLDVSMDSAYRRIRGEKLLDFEELRILCQRFNISLDKFFSLNSDSIMFQGKTNSYKEDSFMEWMEDVLAQLNLVNSFSHKHVYFLVKDMPPFHHYYHPALAGFKFFFWMKSILLFENLKSVKFSIEDNHFEKYREITQKTIKIYNRVPTSEIWNEEGLNTTLRQIEVYHEMGLIKHTEDTIFLYNCVLEVIDHLEKMAETGKKSILGQSPTVDSAEYKMYLNEIVLGDNTFMAELGDTKITYLNHSVMYFIGSMDPKFNDSMFRNLENLMKRSTLISGTGEKERKQFFNKLRKKVESKISKIDIKIDTGP
ncbi:hypothetical protein SAMN03080617_00338 [Algoriphagus alkaliphilus]|uniref:BetR domain-containing protein n=1 Tax=Algoriphagus alkaliphilus TaxID=279824 RepID=A0A1G5VAI0_9BACT|nr:hypothetical protein [Algoriphagus alkaliphilus]SDA42025.1 hypothetical protein SAMN03080617_00338 [Algoriphagus alkaliphilus]